MPTNYRPGDAPVVEANEQSQAHRLYPIADYDLIPADRYVINVDSKCWSAAGGKGQANVPVIHDAACWRVRTLPDLPTVATRTNATLYREEAALRANGKMRYDWCACARKHRDSEPVATEPAAPEAPAADEPALV